MGSKNRSLADDDYHMSLDAIAKELGISRQYVWAIEKSALAKIRHKLREWENYERKDNRTDLFAGRWAADFGIFDDA